jgi:hypothetical protein
MIRSLSPARVASASVLLALVLAPAGASAQAPPLSESVVIGGWTFRPSIELRTRGELRRHPVDTGGDLYGSTAVLAEGFETALPPVVGAVAPVETQWLVGERARIGLAVDHGPITGVITVQDARLWGSAEATTAGAGGTELPSTAPYEAYLDLHTRSGRRVFFRLGRQRVVWGDGRLLGESDWSFTPRSLDAARLGIQLGDFDVEALAAILAAPGSAPPSVAGSREPVEGTGAQLYGLNAVWHLLPLLQIDLTGLARVVRDPHPIWLASGDTYVLDARASGDRRGFRYAVEGAYELGRVASYGANRDLGALALAARAELETALPGHLTFGARGAYASGDDGSIDPSETQRRFDPILPDEHANHAPMGLYGWSNSIEAGGTVRVRPLDELTFTAGYTLAALASPEGRWVTARLFPVGSDPENGSRSLGHEIDAGVTIQPWEPLRFDLGYGLFLFGDGAKAILAEAHRPADLQHWAFLQATVSAP